MLTTILSVCALLVLTAFLVQRSNKAKRAGLRTIAHDNVSFCRRCEHPYSFPDLPLRCERCEGRVDRAVM